MYYHVLLLSSVASPEDQITLRSLKEVIKEPDFIVGKLIYGYHIRPDLIGNYLGPVIGHSGPVLALDDPTDDEKKVASVLARRICAEDASRLPDGYEELIYPIRCPILKLKILTVAEIPAADGVQRCVVCVPKYDPAHKLPLPDSVCRSSDHRRGRRNRKSRSLRQIFENIFGRPSS